MDIHKTRYQEIPAQVQNFLSLPGRQEFSGFHDHTALQAEMQAFLEFSAVKNNSVDNQHTFFFLSQSISTFTTSFRSDTGAAGDRGFLSFSG